MENLFYSQVGGQIYQLRIYEASRIKICGRKLLWDFDGNRFVSEVPCCFPAGLVTTLKCRAMVSTSGIFFVLNFLSNFAPALLASLPVCQQVRFQISGVISRTLLLWATVRCIIARAFCLE